MKLKILTITTIIILITLNLYAEIPIESINCGVINGGHYEFDGECNSNDYDVTAYFYATSAEKSAAYSAQGGTGTTLKINNIRDGSIWNCQGKGTYVGICNPQWHSWTIKYFCCPLVAECPGGGDIYNEALEDTDGDGLPDVCDPRPDDPNPAIFKIISTQGTSGNETYLAIQMKDGSFMSYGTYDSNETEYLKIGEPWRNQSWLQDNGWCDSYDGGESGESESPIGEIGIEIPPVENPEDLEEGIGNDGNTIETDYLADIVTNTQNTTDNMQSISDQLHQLHVDNVNSQIENLQDEVEEQQEAQEEIGEIENIEDSFDGEFTEGDKPSENLIQDVLDGFISNNPLNQVISETEIDIVNSFCSFDWDYKGDNITFSICEYEDQLEMMGNILIAITGLCCLVIIMRRT